MSPLGYAHLHSSLRLSAFEPERPARTASVTRVTQTPDALLIPVRVAPKSLDPLDHIVFALTVMISPNTPDHENHDRFPPLQGAFRLARRNRSMGAEHAPRIPHLTPRPLSRKRARGDLSVAGATFTLKHEGVNLQILAQALRTLPAATMIDAIKASRSGVYIRTACFLWGHFNAQELDDLPAIVGPTVNLFDPGKYLTGPASRNARWRVNFNGLGNLRFCVSVERTPVIDALLAEDILGSAEQFLSQLGSAAAERAMAWAYLHETESSFAVERAKLSANKAEAFVDLLKQAHQARPLDEAYLVDLQNTTVTNPLDMAVGYRHQQNWLRGPLRGAAGITYVPPSPELVPSLMDGLQEFTNTASKQIDPLVTAAITSFAFVLIHPFMDGNGRLSRFLFHHAPCRSGRLGNGLLLPVAVAMQRNEAAYLRALQSFSRPARKRWDVRWIGDDDYNMRFLSDETIYRYWDATPGVEFALTMAKQALDHDLKEETDFLAKFDDLFKAIDHRFDVRNSDLTILVLSCLQNKGRVSVNRRKKFALTVPSVVFDAIEEACAELQRGEP